MHFFKNIEEGDIYIYRYKFPHSLEEITRLLHQSHFELAQGGLLFLASHQNIFITLYRLMKGKSYILCLGGNIIGTITLRILRNNIGYIDQFAILPNYQKKGLGSDLLKFIEIEAKGLNIKTLQLDTAEPAEHLIKFYLDRGFKMVRKISKSYTNYISVIMEKIL